jgi:3-hydroxybutyryl-CoA dehydrogenase
LAWLCSRAGYRTVLEDVLPANLRRAKDHFEEMVETSRDQGPDRGRVEFAGSVEDAVRDADLIVDCVPDELESKLEIFSLLDRMAPPRSILATPTRTLSIADLASCTYRPERCVALELAPGFLANGQLPAEATIVYTSRTLPEVLGMVTDFGKRIGLEVALRPDRAESVSLV